MHLVLHLLSRRFQLQLRQSLILLLLILSFWHVVAKLGVLGDDLVVHEDRNCDNVFMARYAQFARGWHDEPNLAMHDLHSAQSFTAGRLDAPESVLDFVIGQGAVDNELGVLTFRVLYFEQGFLGGCGLASGSSS